MDKEKKILEAWIFLFWKFWFKKVSIDQIVKKAWIAKWTFYLYFKNKDELYEKIIFWICERWNEKMKFLAKSIKDPKERIFIKMIKSIIFFRNNKLLFNLATWNELFYSKNINMKFVEKTHDEMISSLITSEEIDWLSVDLKELTWVFHFFSFVIFIEKFTKSEEEFLNFVETMWEIFIKWIFSESDFDWKNMFKKHKKIFLHSFNIEKVY